jgi:hypothetical protein
MAVTPEQRAVLQLLLERGQSYSDLATLLGVDKSELRSRARAALTELAGADPDRNVGLTDYLLGQADPIGRADAVRHLQADPDDHQLASDLTAILREAFPGADLPRLPGEPRQPRRLRSSEESEGSSRISGIDLSQRQTRLLAILGAGAVILIAAVLGITGALGGDDSSADSTSSTTSSTTASDQTVEQVKLTAPNGGNAKGQAVFGLATGDQLYVDVTIDRLDPAPEGKTYVIWLMIKDNKGYPLSPITMSNSGQFHDRFSVPSAVLPIAARTQVVDVSIAPDDEIANLVKSAIKNTELLLEKPGETVLSGTVPKAPQTGGGGGSGSGSAG